MGFRRAGFATVALVGLLSFAMPTAAMADVNPVVAFLAPVVALGGGAGAAGAAPEAEAAMGLVCSTGVGCAVLAGAAVVGIGLYATQDTWMPWVRNTFGTALDTRSGAGCGTIWCVDFATAPVAGARSDYGATTGFSLRMYVIGGSGDWLTGGHYSPGGAITLNCVTAAGVAYTSKASNNPTSGSLRWGDGRYWSFNFPAFPSPGLGTSETVAFAGCDNYNGAQGSITGFKFDGGTGTEGPSAAGLTWGHSNAIADVQTSLKVKCANPDGSQFEVTSTSPLNNDMVRMPTCTGAPGSQPGAHGVCVTMSAGAVGGPLVEQSSDCAATALAQGATKVLYPNCVGANYCTYVIRHNGVPCEVGVPGCTDWAIRVETAPLEYQCFYGPYELPLADCKQLERIYEVTTTQIPATDANTDGNPRTYNLPIPGYWPTPGTAPTGDPTPLPTTRPTPGSSPTPSPGTGPAPGPGPGEANPVPTSDSADCFPSGWSAFNPAEWVLRPVKCALTWAFVPSAVFLDTWSGGVKNNWGNSPFGHWLGAIGGFAALNIPSGGCQGPGLPTGLLGSGFGAIGPITAPTIYPFAACSGVMATVAATSNLILTAGISFFGGMRVVQQLGYAFGFKVHVGSEINK